MNDRLRTLLFAFTREERVAANQYELGRHARQQLREWDTITTQGELVAEEIVPARVAPVPLAR